MLTIGIVDNDRFALALLAQTVGRAMAGAKVVWAVESGAQGLIAKSVTPRLARDS